MQNQDTILLENANIYTFGDTPGPTKSLAIHGGHIVALDDREHLRQTFSSNFTCIDLGGRIILPGLTDAHIHFEKFSLNHEMIDCDTESIDECLERIKRKAEMLEPGDWIRGHGWDQNLWGRYGTKEELDLVTANNPAYITAKSLHAAWANTTAIIQAGLSANSADPPKGKIQRREDGSVTGIFFEYAMLLISAIVPQPSPSELSQAMLRGQDELLRLGITSIHDFDGARCLQAMQLLREDSQLQLRVVKSIHYDAFESFIEAGLRTGFGDEWIRIGAVKLFSDGALGPRTAAMLDPYEADTSDSGDLLLTVEEIVEIGTRAAVNGLALAIHAIGDRANREVLDAFEELRAFEAKNHLKPLAHRIEHLQLLSQKDTCRPADLDIIVSMQPIHATSDMRMADRHWGKRVQQSYGWRSQIDAGSKLLFGSDAPVESANPFLGIYAAVTRKPLSSGVDAAPWVPEQRISLQEAFNAYSVWPAQAIGLGSKLGRLLPGYRADLIVLDEDPFLLDHSELPAIKPSGVMVDGKWHFLD
ncbi:MAG: amidohydrolase [Anaerolineales bacterium]|nr:amidohydrolase [Anaerolineales bacterium]